VHFLVLGQLWRANCHTYQIVLQRGYGYCGTYRLNRSLVINNAPDLLKLAVSGYDADGTFTTADIEAEAPLGGPSGAFMSGNDKNVATGEFDLTKSPGTTAGQNFRLESRGGRFRFVVSGHIEITRLKLGSTGSAWKRIRIQSEFVLGGA
jgi:hypothetical protein